MSWQLLLLLIFGAFLILMVSGMPVAFAFMLINVVGVALLWGGESGLTQLSLSMFNAVANINLLPIPLFILMGEAMFLTGVAQQMIDALDKWMGRIPGRLSLLAVAGGTVFATLSGSSMAGVALLGSSLIPEMEKHGYRKAMTLGPILGAGGLAIMIPPSALAVVLGSIGQISIGKILIGIIVPGLIMALLYAAYIIIRCALQPSLAPAYDVVLPPLKDRVMAFVKYVLPLSLIVFLVIGVIILGIATPTEAAALGTLGAFLLAALYKRLKWVMVRNSLESTIRITIMVLLIISGAVAFSQILAFSGATRGLVEFAVGLPVSPILILISMQAVMIVMGCFMELNSIMMITLPIFMPIVISLGLDPVWFGVITLLNMEIGAISPPFGLSLFVMKGVAPVGTTMGAVYRAGAMFSGLDILVMGLLIAFPPLSLWLPGLMG